MNVSYGHNMKGFIHIFLLACIFVFLPISASAAKTGKKDDTAVTPAANVDLNFEVVKGDYEYLIEDRADPFVPFYTGEAAAETIDPNEIVDSNQRLTGMQLFEPGQLNLVALMKVKGVYIAMVEDFKGQGYIVREGTKIGKRGTVKKIIANKVLIEEVAVTRAGKELRSEIVMALRKEGEE